MKRPFGATVVALVALASTFLGQEAAQAATNVVPDAGLRECLTNAMTSYGGVPEQAGIITANDLAALNAKTAELNCRGYSIQSLDGLQYLPALTKLLLDGNSIASLSPLAGLQNLVDLELTGNQIVNLSPLVGLSKLTTLVLDANPVSDLSPLAGLISLSDLSLNDALVSNLAPLAGLTNLTILGLLRNHVSDVSALSNLTKLSVLSLTKNSVSNVAPLAGLNIQTLGLSGNAITDISPLQPLLTAGRDIDAKQQVATGPSVPVGTYPIPIKAMSGDPLLTVTVFPASGATINLTAGTITYNTTGTFTLSWQSNLIVNYPSAEFRPGFSGSYTLTVSAAGSAPAGTMYRIFNSSTGEHFYTSSANEVLVNLGGGTWSYEGIGWVAPASGTPVYRLAAIPESGSAGHLFTTSVTERDAALASKNPAGQPYWTCETGAGMPACVGWYSGGSVPLFRAFNPMPGPGLGQHNYTTDANEQHVITGTGPQGGWNGEGIGWYGVQKGDPRAPVPVK